MASELDNRQIVFKGIQAATYGDARNFLSIGRELEARGWDSTGLLVVEVLFSAVRRLPSPDSETAARITDRAVSRFDGELSIIRPIMEVEIRQAGGESGLVAGIPRNLGMIHALLAVGQIVHEGYLSVEETLEIEGNQTTGKKAHYGTDLESI